MPFPVCDTPAHVAAFAANPPPRAAARPRMAVPEVCITPAQLARSEELGGSYDASEETTHFVIAWDSSDATVTEAAVATVAEALETSWDVEVDQMGWLAPSQTESCFITVILSTLPESWGDTGGYTNVYEDGGVPYIVLNTAWLADDDDWTRTLVAHEFNHASQFAYDRFWDATDWWYWESTAEWITDLVYDDANTYTWSLWSYFDAPWRGLESNLGLVQYGHFAFNTFLEESLGEDAPRRIWDAEGTHVADAAEVAFASEIADFDELVLGYTSHVAAFDVAERDVWLDALGYFEVDPYTAHVATLPAGGSVAAREAPEERGQGFLHFAGPPESAVEFHFEGVGDVGGVATDWAITVATVGADGAVTHRVADATDVDLGEGWADAYVGVIPLGAIGAEGAEWSWSAKLAGADEEELPAACACSTGAPVYAWFALVLPLLAARRRD